ncbi:dihydroorotate dehydrogenase electron transfer subunit [Peptoniphilus sp. oral taxon 386]|uniref:dihydroorotate dehydrogenase electron transfer subunit n=1 Tax=Peptoniphilus sp. oral taxon 386 TaxID=652713 RepID=UPI0001DA9ACC|nr:dihydroorotate dehydrogenase electron transfer subunit [Peptoniphilus sp. oral taxon 386]EFI42022.1 oxidoreductase NAD-binding domain protein [Peptoniphilus sp. oral taxon 386 str. F0131]
MASVIYNREVDKNYFLMKVDEISNVEPGQFYMLRAWDNYPTLSRPISVFDVQEDGILFLYEVRGIGTKLLSKLRKNDEIKLFGPYGNHFCYKNKREISLVSGGVGAAPFYYLSKCLKRYNESVKIDLYIGERENQNLEMLFKDLDVNLKAKKGGFITDILEYDKKLIYTCGPEIMMRKVFEYGNENNCEVYMSLENRMGCGVGACLSCVCKTKDGNKRACKEGPVFFGGDLVE